MRNRGAVQLKWAVAWACLGLVPGLARAQTGAGASGATSGLYGGNPYSSPAMNPFLNPYMAQMAGPNMTTGNAALYFFAAQQANGGIGSGQLSGVRPPRGGVATRGQTSARVAPENSSMVPGGIAARYFNRDGARTDVGLARYYNHPGPYYPKRGR